MNKEKYYLIVIENDVCPRQMGPYKTTEERDNAAKQIRTNDGPEHGLFRLDIDFDDEQVDVYSFSNSFFEEDE